MASEDRDDSSPHSRHPPEELQQDMQEEKVEELEPEHSSPSRSGPSSDSDSSGEWTQQLPAYLSHSENSSVSCSRRVFLALLSFRRAKLVTVEPVMFFFMLSNYLFLALMELYCYQRYALEALANSTYDLLNASALCINASFLDEVVDNGTNTQVQDKAALLVLAITGAGQLASAVVTLVVGPFSDKLGRKIVLALPLLGNVIASVVNFLIVLHLLDVRYFFIPASIMGVTGGFGVVIATCVAYLAEVSSLRWLTLHLSILQGMLLLSQVLADVIADQWLKSSCNYMPLLFLILAAGLLALVLLLWPPEFTSRTVRLRKMKQRNGSNFAMLTQGCRIFLCPGHSRWRLWFALLILVITAITGTGTLAILSVFQHDEPLKWDEGTVSIYRLVSTVANVLSVLVVLPGLVVIAVPDPLLVLLGLCVSSGANFLSGFITTTWEMFVVGILPGLYPSLSPLIRSIVSKLVPRSEQGAVFAMVTAAQVFALSSASVFCTLNHSLYSHLTSVTVGLPFFITAALNLLPLPLAIFLLVARKGGVHQEYFSSETSTLLTMRRKSWQWSHGDRTNLLFNNQ